MAIEFFADPELNQFVIVVGAGLVAAIIIYFAMRNFLPKLVEKTSFVRKGLANSIPKPVFLLVFLAGLSYGLRSLTILNPYEQLISDAFFASAVLISAYAFASLTKEGIIGWLKAKKGLKNPPKIISKIVAAVIYLIGISIILIHFNVEVTPLIATLGIGGIAIGLALQGTLSNFFAGLNVISDKPVRVGDFVEVEVGSKEPLLGWVEDIGWRTTKIKTEALNIVVVPNAKLAESVITNYSIPDEEVVIFIPCGVSYESDLDLVEKVTLETVDYFKEINPNVLKESKASFRLREFGDSNINFRIYFSILGFTNQYKIRNDFMKELKKRFDKAGIEMSWPIRKIYNFTPTGKK
ncbi:MAG TPA: mechanosensitive ion channel family protein [archaeon]|nr:mechanosensitive ion channel family protein [archaeon]